MIKPDGSKLDRDLFDIATWKNYRWSIFNSMAQSRIRKKFNSDIEFTKYNATLEQFFKKNLMRSKKFHFAINKPVAKENFSMITIGSDCYLTPARCLVEDINGATMVRLAPNDIVNKLPDINYEQLMLEPGDGSVTKPSLLGRNSLDPSIYENTNIPLAYSFFICQAHDQLPGDITFADNLLNILLTQDTTEDRFNKKNLKK